MGSTWHKAAIDGDLAQLTSRIIEGQDINHRDRYGQTATMLAAVHGHQELVNMLIAHNAYLDVTAKHGLSALMLAVINGHMDIARTLVQAGANLNLQASGAPGFAGKSAYDLAMARGFTELAETIRRHQP